MASAVLATVIENGIVVEQASSSDSWVIGLAIILIGLFNAFCPYTSWYLSYGLILKDGEPSDGFLLWNRILGIIAILIGIGFLVV